MRRFLQACLFVFLVTGSLLLPTTMKRLTHSFHVARLFYPFDLYPKNNSFGSLEAVGHILSQNFYYLDRGSQAFVFLSADRSVVLKLFIFDSKDSVYKRFFHRSDTLFFQQVQDRANHLLKACKLASQHLPDETAILYTHLTAGSENLPIVHLIGPAWKRIDVSLNSLRFCIQKRADSLIDSLLQTVQCNDAETFYHLIDQLNVLLDHRTACGIANTDPTLFENFGVIGDKVVEIDFGNYISCPEMIDFARACKEKARYTDQLLKWIEQNSPQWKEGVVMRCKEGR